MTIVLAASAARAVAQDLPGSSPLAPTLRSPYEEPRLPPLRLPGEPAPRRREPPRLVFVPDLRFGAGYSDNIFITPDVLGFRAVSDGISTVSPRMRALFRLTRELGVIGDYALNWQKFFSNGYAVQNSGSLFVGYRPTVENHGELGVRGGTTHVSKFSQSNADEVQGFLSGAYELAPAVAFAGSVSAGVREFPDRTRRDTSALFLGIGPLELPIPIGTTTTVRKGEDDVIANIAGGLVARYGETGAVRVSYDFTSNDADFSELDFRSQRLGITGVYVWTSWLQTQASYSASFRRFLHAPADLATIERRDTIQDVTVGLNVAPGFLREPWFLRSVIIHVDYDFLIDRSNVASAEFHRNLVMIGVDLGINPITGEQIAGLVGR